MDMKGLEDEDKEGRGLGMSIWVVSGDNIIACFSHSKPWTRWPKFIPVGLPDSARGVSLIETHIDCVHMHTTPGTFGRQQVVNLSGLEIIACDGGNRVSRE